MTRTEITMTQLVAAPPTEVYDAWVDAEQLATWWWPQIPDTTYELDVRVGGGYRIHSAAAAMGVHGRFLSLDRPHRLELSWIWEDGDVDGTEERVVVDFATQDGGTLVTVRHTTGAAGAGDFAQGWTDCLARLVRVGH